MKKFIILLLIICIVGVFYTPDLVFAADSLEVARDKIDKQIVRFIKFIGYAFVIIAALRDILSEVRNGDIKAAISSALRYLIMYGILLMLPKAFRWVESFIEGLW